MWIHASVDISTGTHTVKLSKRLLVLIPAATLALYASVVGAAEPAPTVTISVYNNYGYNNAPPIPDETRLAGTTGALDIWHNFDQQPMFNLYEDFAVRFDSNISAPCSCAVVFMAQADDGTRLYINNTLIADDWRDKGGGGIQSTAVQFIEGQSQPLTLWFYENGGGAWVQLWWYINDTWQRVPMSAFTADVTTPTTTTVELPTTTTTEQPTTTSLLETTTTYAPSTTIATTTTSTTTPSTTQPTSTTSPTTTTTVVTTTTVATTTLPPLPTTTQPLNQQIDEQIDQQQAVAIATNSALLATATAEQAEQIFDAINIGELSDAEASAIVDAVQDAPTEVRASFEQEIDIYSGKTDSYIPLGSLVNVATRRVLVVSVAFTIAMPVAPTRRSL